MSFKKTNRVIHKWSSIVIVLPLLVVFCTGILLLLKKEISFIQPPSQKGMTKVPSVHFDQVLEAAKSVDAASVTTWEDIDRLDVRPSKGIIKIRTKDSIEIQIDSASGDVLQVAKRRSDFIETIHDGTFFQKKANLWLMLPVAIIALLMTVTGIIMFVQAEFKTQKNRPSLLK